MKEKGSLQALLLATGHAMGPVLGSTAWLIWSELLPKLLPQATDRETVLTIALIPEAIWIVIFVLSLSHNRGDFWRTHSMILYVGAFAVAAFCALSIVTYVLFYYS